MAVEREYWGTEGAGILVIAKDTCKFLISKRSHEVNEPHTYGIVGGKTDGRESPEVAAKREFKEETGYQGQISSLGLLVRYRKPNFTYHNFVGVVPYEFVPDPNWESERMDWMTLKEIRSLENKHFGLSFLLRTRNARLTEIENRCLEKRLSVSSTL